MRVMAATAEHNAYLLQLLEENAMCGDIDVVMTRRPNYFFAPHRFGDEYPVIAFDGVQPIGMCQLTQHLGFANGKLQPLGYLGGLRVVTNYRHRIRLLKAGFDYLRQLAPPEHCYTSIAADNTTARRILERGVDGLPSYQLLGEMQTLAISRRQAKPRGLWRLMAPQQYPQVADFYNRLAIERQLAPQLSAQWLASVGLPVLGFEDAQGLHACAVLWNQQAFKQVLVKRYSRRMEVLRWLWNGYATLTGRICLPQMGQAIDQSFLAYFACDNSERVADLVVDALRLCATPVMTLGLPATAPFTATLIAQTRPRVYRTCLYGVKLVGQPTWESRMVWPEVALL